MKAFNKIVATIWNENFALKSDLTATPNKAFN